jgi:hypothetical protein
MPSISPRPDLNEAFLRKSLNATPSLLGCHAKFIGPFLVTLGNPAVTGLPNLCTSTVLVVSGEPIANQLVEDQSFVATVAKLPQHR